MTTELAKQLIEVIIATDQDADDISNLCDDYIEAERETDEHWGLPVFTIDGEEYAFADCTENAEAAAEEYILNSIWAFRPEFLEAHMPLEAGQIRKLQEDCESANEGLKRLLNDEEHFVSDAIAAGGLGNFLSPYDYEGYNGHDLWTNAQLSWIAAYLDEDANDLKDGTFYRIN